MVFEIQRSSERGHVRLHWLNSFHSFSFGSYYNPKKMGFGTLRVINHDIIAAKSGFGMHPHESMEIITIVLRGALSHTDSLGNTGSIGAGEVQVMSAGSGIFHSEENVSADEEVELLQIWIYPKKNGGSPRYNQRAYPSSLDSDWQLLVSPIDSLENTLKIQQNAYITRKKSIQGDEISYIPHDTKNGAYLLVLSGTISFAGHTLSSFDAAAIQDFTQLDFVARTDADVMIFEVPM